MTDRTLRNTYSTALDLRGLRFCYLMPVDGSCGIGPEVVGRSHCRSENRIYICWMVKRTSPDDAKKISVAADLEELVQDKREGWRASGAKARRRQRRYKSLLTQQLLKMEPADPNDADQDFDE